MENKIEVFYHNKKVGTIARLNDKYAFQYCEEWISEGFSISPFTLPLSNEVFIPSKMIFNGMFGVFADSLPDSWGKLLLDRYLKKQGIKSYDGLYMLACIGKHGMGALEYKPNFSKSNEKIINFDDYQKQADLILSDEKSSKIDIDFLYKNGGSSGGARPKALVNYNNEEWIIKFQSKYDIDNCGLCEYEYSLACKEIGINIPETKLFPSIYNSGYFGIKRFDRKNNEKVHMISASALLEADYRSPCLDYLDLFKLTKIITKDNKKDIEDLYLRMCFNVYAHNLDDHLKNFSYLYDENTNSYRLSPAYDMVFSNTYYMEHTTSINGKGKDISDEDLIKVGLESGLSKTFCVQKLDLVKKIVLNRLSKYLK